MCLLFFYINNDATADEYKLILVNSRDEFWKRPTKLADFWSNNADCISGLDEQPGREGGTWLGMNKNGRIGVLINILGFQDPDKKGRGFLVNDFITSQEETATYITKLAETKSHYNGFHLILLDKREDKFHFNFVTNSGIKEDESIDKTEYVGVGNSPLSSPWLKVVEGKEVFRSVITKHLPHQKQQLMDNLFDFMFDKTQFYPDPVLFNQAKAFHPVPIIIERAARFVWSPSIEYGTRTTSVILVNGSGKCDFIEKTLICPVNIDDPQYTSKSYQFQLI